MADIDDLEREWEGALSAFDPRQQRALVGMRSNLENRISGVLGVVANQMEREVFLADANARQTNEDSQTIIDTAVEFALKRMLDTLNAGGGDSIANSVVNNMFGGTVNITKPTGSFWAIVWDNDAQEWTEHSTTEITVVTDVQYDTGLDELQKRYVTIQAIITGSNEISAWEAVVGGAASSETIVTDVQYDATTKQVQKKTVTGSTFNTGTETAWTLITGGQAVEETT